jgi:hypothetical protein
MFTSAPGESHGWVIWGNVLVLDFILLGGTLLADSLQV